MRHNGRGRLVTLEGAPGLAAIARRTLGDLRLADVDVEIGRFDTVLPRVLSDGPYGFAFIDGHHDEAATVGYHRQLLPHLDPGAVLVFDDIAWSDGMARAWGVVARDPSTAISVDLGAMGVCIAR
jgi:predicted O-methyltransferase YrrM